MPPNKKAYPTPLSFPASSGKHTHTFILLHGRGSNADRFGREFLESSNISARLPTVKFVFPTASKRRSTVLKKIPINQWFDNYSLEDPGQRTDLQVEGLHQTAEFLRLLIKSEANDLGEGGLQKVILGGLSQGCAAGVFTYLGGGFGNDDRQPLGGFVGMSGWLPFEAQLRGIVLPSLTSGNDADEFDPFARSTEDGEDGDDDDSGGQDAGPPDLLALNHIRDILDLSALSFFDSKLEKNYSPAADHLQSPVFLGHGSSDPKVSVQLGERMANFLSTELSIDVTWKAYEEFGHWYKVPDEIDDIVLFLKEKVGVPIYE